MARYETATRSETLHLMGELRVLANLGRLGKAEDRILEIAEVAYIVRADGFPEPAVFERLARVFGTPPPPEYGQHLHDYTLEHVRPQLPGAGSCAFQDRPGGGLPLGRAPRRTGGA